jgi:hypothetical protein
MDITQETCYLNLQCPKERPASSPKKSEVLQGTLDLMILKTLQAMGPLHGFGIARRLEQLSEEVLHLNEALFTPRY